MNTIFLFWHFSKFCKCLVYESPGDVETPPHSVSLAFLLDSFSLRQLCCPRLSPCFTACPTVSPPV